MSCQASLNAHDPALIMRALSDAAEITMKFLEGNQAMETVRVLGNLTLFASLYKNIHNLHLFMFMFIYKMHAYCHKLKLF